MAVYFSLHALLVLFSACSMCFVSAFCDKQTLLCADVSPDYAKRSYSPKALAQSELLCRPLGCQCWYLVPKQVSGSDGQQASQRALFRPAFSQESIQLPGDNHAKGDQGDHPKHTVRLVTCGFGVLGLLRTRKLQVGWSLQTRAASKGLHIAPARGSARHGAAARLRLERQWEDAEAGPA